jgi:hypothetical protein
VPYMRGRWRVRSRSAVCPVMVVVLAGTTLLSGGTASARTRPTSARSTDSPVEYDCPILSAEDPLNQEIADAPVNPTQQLT